MTDTKEQARLKVADLVESFRQTLEHIRAGYNEQETRLYFVLPLFEALGWDTRNPTEMSAEEQISRGFVDFGFYLNGVPAFYLETKKIQEDLDKPEWGRQAINYAWLKGVTWAVLTDFEGIKVFNAEVQEKIPARAIFLDLQWEHYASDQFEKLWLLSKESLLTREIDQQAENWGRKSHKKPVSELLFAQLTTWRRDLFKQMHAYGGLLARDTQKLDEAVQRFLDRLIFIRSVEDRGVEPPRLRAILRQYKDSKKKGKNLFDDLLALFREMDKIYNARLFAQHQLDLLQIHDDILLEDIINGLYDAPGGYDSYDFNAISADVLGNIYEQYLSFKAQDPTGKDAIDPSHDKQSRRKKQGIYYTPQYVVRYIVQQTLGKMLEELDNPLDAYNLRILDPACGSGSFLIEAFDVLDRFLAQHGTADDQAHPRQRRLRILRDNIYGVDLDPQAVEVARLNLLLRAAAEREKLPMLDNIKVGNSLIDDPAIAGDAAFNWQEQFPEVMNAGGFDVVVGNPPYVYQVQDNVTKSYFANNYMPETTVDIYVYFIEKGYSLLKESGRFGVIVSNKWMRAGYGNSIREWMALKYIEEIIDFGDLPIFQEATTYPCIIRLRKGQPQPQFYATEVKTLDFPSLDHYVIDHRYSIMVNQLDNKTGWALVNSKIIALIRKTKDKGTNLEDYIAKKIFYGIKTGLNKAFVIDEKTKIQLETRDPSCSQLIKPFLAGRDIKRYETPNSQRFLILIPHGWTHSNNLENKDPWEWFRSHYPSIAEHLLQFKSDAERRSDMGEFWWELRPCDYYNEFERPKIMLPDISIRGNFILDKSKNYCVNTAYIIGNSENYLLGILNSRLLTFYYTKLAASYRGGYLRFIYQYLAKLPIRTIDFDKPDDVAKHDRMVAMVERMMELKKQHAEAEALYEDRRHDLARQIERLDADIDTLVYDLYGLTEEEIAIVEGRA